MASLRSYLVSQFHRPRGPLGALAGQVLARRPSNVERNRWTVDLLGIRAADRVLELGFGPGLSIARAAALASEGKVVGIDHSRTMVRMAARRNARAIRAGRVELRCASFADLGGDEEPYDRIFAVNSFQFSDDPRGTLAAIRRLLRPGGTFAITFQSRKPGASDEDSRRGGEECAKQMREAGLVDVRVEILPLEPVCAVCVLGREPAP